MFGYGLIFLAGLLMGKEMKRMSSLTAHIFLAAIAAAIWAFAIVSILAGKGA